MYILIYTYFRHLFMRSLLFLKNAFDKSELADMVREVNEQGVSQDEILSDNVYEYNRKNGLITM